MNRQYMRTLMIAIVLVALFIGAMAYFVSFIPQHSHDAPDIDLDVERDASTVTVEIVHGDDAVIPSASATEAGVMTAPDYSLLVAVATAVAEQSGGGNPPPPRYAALRAAGSAPADCTEADFTGSTATRSHTPDIYTADSATDSVVCIAVPTALGPLAEVAELASDGTVNQFATSIRDDFAPSVDEQPITLDIAEAPHYVYATTETVRSVLLGQIGYRLTQTQP